MGSRFLTVARGPLLEILSPHSPRPKTLPSSTIHAPPAQRRTVGSRTPRSIGHLGSGGNNCPSASPRPTPTTCPGPTPIEEDIGLGILHHRFVDLGDILVIELIPLPIDHVLAVGNVVAACNRRGRWVTDTLGDKDGDKDGDRFREGVARLTACCAVVADD